MKLGSTLLLPVAALLLALPAAAQEARPCPDVEPGDARPVELRIAGVLLRVEVAERPTEVAEGTSVDVRLVACEEEREGAAREEAREPGAAGEAAAPEGSGLLSLLHDLRLGVALGPSADGRCMQARFDVPADSAAGGEPADPAEPFRFELCGFSFGKDDADATRREEE